MPGPVPSHVLISVPVLPLSESRAAVMGLRPPTARANPSPACVRLSGRQRGGSQGVSGACSHIPLQPCRAVSGALRSSLVRWHVDVRDSVGQHLAANLVRDRGRRVPLQQPHMLTTGSLCLHDMMRRLRLIREVL